MKPIAARVPRCSLAAPLLLALTAGAWGQCTVPRERIPTSLPTDVRGWIDSLYATNAAERAEGAAKLGERRVAEAVPFLVGLLHDHGPTYQGKMFAWQPPDVPWGVIVTSPGYEAARALVRIGAASAEPLLAAVDAPYNPLAAFALGELRERRAADILLRRGGDPQAMLALGKIGDPRAIAPLVEQLGGAWSRFTAADALTACWPLGAEPLIQAVGNRDLKGDQAAIRANAADLLGRMGERRAVPALIAALKEPGDARRHLACARALQALGDPAAVDALLGALADESWQVRKTAACALGELGAPAAIEGLTRCLADPDNTVRGHAARSLGRLGAAQAADRLLPLLNDRYAFVRTEAMMALASLRDARALDATVKAVQDPDPGVRRQAVAALGLLGGERAAAELAGRLGDRDPVLRANAVAALIRTGPAAVRPVAALMAGPEHAGAWEFLTPAGEVLAALGPPAVSNCAALMNHPRWEVQVTAAAALARMNPPGLDALIEALRHGNAFRAAQALGGVADPRATDALLEALRNPNVGVVAEAVRALARQHAARGVESVIPLLDHPDGHVKEAAREALEQLTRQYLGPAPAPWKRWWEANKKTLLAEPQEGQR